MYLRVMTNSLAILLKDKTSGQKIWSFSQAKRSLKQTEGEAKLRMMIDIYAVIKKKYAGVRT